MAKNEFQDFIEKERKLGDKRYIGQPVNERNKKPSPKKPLPVKGPQGPQGPKSLPRKGDDMAYIQPYPYRQPPNTKREIEAGLVMKSLGKKK